MISPELLRRFPLFHSLSDSQLGSIAMIAREDMVNSGAILFREGLPADNLYILKDGSIGLYYLMGDKTAMDFQKGIPVGEINPGEMFCISALIEPHVITSTAQASKQSVVIKIHAETLRNLFNQDQKLAYHLTYQAAKSTVERLHITRIQLAAAWA